MSYYLVPQQGMFVVAIFRCCYDIINGSYDTSAWSLPMGVSVPFDTESVFGWFLLLFIQFNISIAYSLIVVFVTTYFMCCCSYLEAICEHFDMLIDMVEKDVERNQEEANPFKYRNRKQQIRTNLCNAIIAHGDVYE